MAKKKTIKASEATQPPKEVQIPYKWNVPDTMNSNYASNVLVQIMENEFKITFFEAKPQIRLNPTDPSPTELRADCVASIILHPKKVLALINALDRQYKLYQAREQAQEKT